MSNRMLSISFCQFLFVWTLIRKVILALEIDTCLSIILVSLLLEKFDQYFLFVYVYTAYYFIVFCFCNIFVHYLFIFWISQRPLGVELSIEPVVFLVSYFLNVRKIIHSLYLTNRFILINFNKTFVFRYLFND